VLLNATTSLYCWKRAVAEVSDEMHLVFWGSERRKTLLDGTKVVFGCLDPIKRLSVLHPLQAIV